MKLKELIARIDKSPDNKNEVDISRFGERVFDCHDMPFNWIEQDRLVSYWVSCWYCTDTWVGEKAYFLDDEFVALSTQLARKSDCTFSWVSKEACDKVKAYVRSFAEQSTPNISILDMDTDFGEGYKISYNSQILSHLKATLDGQPVKIVRSKERSYDDLHSVEIKIGKEKQEIDVDELLFSYLIKGDEND